MDKAFTERIRAWLNQPPSERDVLEGATMLLQLNRNQILFNTIIRRPDREADRLEYHLRKHLRIRDQGHTLRDVVELEERILPTVRATLAEDVPQLVKTAEEVDCVEVEAHYRGRSPHHDLFPERIRQLYERGGQLYEQQKKLYNMLLGMMNAEPCDRHELLLQLDCADKEYREGWAEYDAFAAQFDPEHPNEEEQDVIQTTSPPPDAKAVSAARKFLSEGRKNLATLTSDSPTYTELLTAMQERIDLIVASGGGFKPDYAESLKALGLALPE